MRKISYYLLLGLFGAVFYGCNNDQISSPPQPSFTVDKTSGMIGATEFTFTIKQVNAGSISLFPYGTEDATKGGILLQSSDFSGGVATIKFTYAFVGTFNAVVIANNHTANGNTVKNVRSATQTITLTSNKDAMSAFSLTDNTTDSKNPVTFDGVISGNNIAVTLPYANKGSITKLVATFTTSPFSSVTVGSTAQVSGTTVNDFTNPVIYTVKSSDGTASQNYTVTTTITPVETDNTLKSASGTNVSSSQNKRSLPAFVDNVGRNIVIYDTLGVTDFDSVKFDYVAKGKFATGDLDQDKQLDLTSSKSLVITAQDNSKGTYKIYAVAAPKLEISFNSLNPAVKATTTNFSISADVLNGPGTPLPTYISSLATTTVITTAAGVTVNGITANGASFNSGDPVDFSSAVTFVISVTDANLGGITYDVTYKASVNVVK